MTHISPPGNGVRVLIVTGASAGGYWHYVCALSNALIAIGVEVALAVPFPHEPLESVNDLPVWSLGEEPPGAARLPLYPLRRIGSQVDKMRRFHRAIIGFRPDIVHLHDRVGVLDVVYFRFLKRLGVRVVYTAHDVRSLYGKNNWLDRARRRQADALLVHSSNSVTELVMDGIEESRIIRIPHANYLHFCRASRISPARAKSLLGIAPNARAILFFGFIAPYKGLSVLIDAFALLRRAYPGAYLVIAGRPVESFQPYKRQIEKLKLEGNVISDLRYIPFDEFEKFFSAADVVALPYRRIYQSGVLQLAYAFGRPVVVTNVGGLGDTVSEDCTGLVAQTGDAQGVASAIRDLLSNPAKAEEMGKRGRRLAETKYSWDTVARRVVEVYSSLGASSSEPS